MRTSLPAGVVGESESVLILLRYRQAVTYVPPEAVKIQFITPDDER
jgi:hypothetical protein